MSNRNWPTPTPSDPGQWFGDLEKRIQHQESQPVPKTAADLVGPGIASHAVRMADWNSPEASFNGFWFSLPGDLNTPDKTLHWIGQTIVDDEGYGIQEAWNHREGVWPPICMVRNLYDSGSGIPQRSEWSSQHNLEPSLQDMTISQTYPGAANELAGLGRTLNIRSFSDRYLVSLSASVRCRYPGSEGTYALDTGVSVNGTRMTPIRFEIIYFTSSRTVTISDTDSDSDTSPVVGGPGTVTVDINISISGSDTIEIPTEFDQRLQQSRQWMVGPLTPGEYDIGAWANLLNAEGNFTVFAPHTQMSIIKVA
jgi:hypothetical protein